MIATKIRVWMEYVQMETIRTLAPAIVATRGQTAQVSFTCMSLQLGNTTVDFGVYHFINLFVTGICIFNL